MRLKRYQTGQKNQRLFHTIQVDDLVPEGHLLRLLDAAVDLSFIRELVKDTYDQTTNLGRPAWDPILLAKMMLLGILFDLPDHRLEQEVRMHAGYRWFLGLDFDDPVPDRTTLIKARQRWGLETFRSIFQQVLAQCAEAGLVGGENVVVDGTQIQARAAMTSLEQQVLSFFGEEAASNDDTNHDKGQGITGRPAATPPKSHRRAGDPDFHGQRFRNATHRSRTDPEARLYRKGSAQEAHLRFLGHYLVDRDTGVILAAAASQAYGRAELDVGYALLSEIRDQPWMQERPNLFADKGYDDGQFLADVLKLGYLPRVRLRNPEPEPLPRWKRKTHRLDWLRRRKRITEIVRARNIVRSLTGHAKAPLERARVRVEHAFAEAKEWHGLDRARGYGLAACDWQVLMTATVQNMKRLARALRRRPRASGPAVVMQDPNKGQRVGASSSAHQAKILEGLRFHLLRLWTTPLCQGTS